MYMYAFKYYKTNFKNRVMGCTPVEFLTNRDCKKIVRCPYHKYMRVSCSATNQVFNDVKNSKWCMSKSIQQKLKVAG